MSNWHLVAFCIGWLASLPIHLWYIRRAFRRHEYEIREVRIEERLRAAAIVRESHERQAKLRERSDAFRQRVRYSGGRWPS